MKYDTNNKVLKALNLWEPLKNVWEIMDDLKERPTESPKMKVYRELMKRG